MANDEIKKKQEETLENLKKYNKERNTEIIDDRRLASVEEIAELQNEVSQAISAPKLTLIEREESFYTEDPSEFTKVKTVPYEEPIDDNHPLGLPLLCQWCGTVAYQGQIHGLGYCKEKTQYES